MRFLFFVLTLPLQDNATEVPCDPGISNCTEVEDDHEGEEHEGEEHEGEEHEGEEHEGEEHEGEEHDGEEHEGEEHDAEAVSAFGLEEVHLLSQILTRPCRPGSALRCKTVGCCITCSLPG